MNSLSKNMLGWNNLCKDRTQTSEGRWKILSKSGTQLSQAKVYQSTWGNNLISILTDHKASLRTLDWESREQLRV